MALDATVGGKTSNSYVTLDEANAYFANHYLTVKTTAWAALTDTQKESALKKACQQLETLRILDDELSTGRLPTPLVVAMAYDLTVHRADVGQVLQFPRNLDVDTTGAPFVQQAVKDSQCEQAVYLLSFDDTNLITVTQGIVEDSVVAGPVKSFTKYDSGHAPTYLSPLVVELMRQFTRMSGRIRRM